MYDDFPISGRREEEVYDDEREKRFAKEQISPKFKKQGVRNQGRGAAQSGHCPPANPNAVMMASHPSNKGRSQGEVTEDPTPNLPV